MPEYYAKTFNSYRDQIDSLKSQLGIVELQKNVMTEKYNRLCDDASALESQLTEANRQRDDLAKLLVMARDWLYRDSGGTTAETTAIDIALSVTTATSRRGEELAANTVTISREVYDAYAEYTESHEYEITFGKDDFADLLPVYKQFLEAGK
jgi:hypothetical protein